MVANNVTVALLAALVLASLTSCMKPSGKSYRSRGLGADEGHLDLPATGQLPKTWNAPPAGGADKHVRMKSYAALKTDLEQAFGLKGKDLCTEAGKFACLDDVHKISLGGVKPYEGGVATRWTESPLSAPIALERIAAAACAKRVELDLGGASAAVLWSGLAKGEPGRTTSMKAYVSGLFRRLLARDPSEAELALAIAAAGSYAGAPAAWTSDDVWAWVVCFAVASSVEMVFI